MKAVASSVRVLLLTGVLVLVAGALIVLASNYLTRDLTQSIPPENAEPLPDVPLGDIPTKGAESPRVEPERKPVITPPVPDVPRQVEAAPPPPVAQRAPAGGANAAAVAPGAGELADQLASELAKGNIVFNPPPQMRTGRNEQITVRVSRESVLPAEALSGLQGRGAAQTAQLLTGAFMRVELFGDEGFKITPRGDADQAVPPTGFAEWLFDVLPVSGGERMLTLRVAARYKLPTGEEVRYLPVFTRNISVEVDYWWKTQQFVAANWQYFLSGGGVLAMAVGGYFGKRLVERGGEKDGRRRKRSRA